MTSCSLTRIEGLLRARVAGEGNGPFYRTFAVSPSISMLSSTSHRCRLADQGTIPKLWQAASGKRPLPPRHCYRPQYRPAYLAQACATCATDYLPTMSLECL